MKFKTGITSYRFNIKENNLDKYFLFRYLSCKEHLESFLQNGIYMAQADSFSDQLELIDFESIQSLNNCKDVDRILKENNPDMDDNEFELIKKNANQTLKDLAFKLKVKQKYYHISCWHISDRENENELMWRSFGKRILMKDSKEHVIENGFLLKITLRNFLENLNESFGKNSEINGLIFGYVNYYNFNIISSIKKVKYLGFRKHISFKDEREFRLIHKNNSLENKFIKINNRFYEDCMIFAHPECELDYFNQLREEINKKYQKQIQLSELNIWYKLQQKK